MRIKNTVGDKGYGRPFYGALNQTDHVKVVLSGLTTAEVDVDGYLKPGVPFRQDGTLVTAVSQIVWGVTPETIQLNVVTPVTNATLAAEVTTTNFPLVAVGTMGQVNRDIIEYNLGRALTANEISAFGAAGCTVKLSTT